MINTTVGAGAASRYGSGSGSDQKMRLLAAPAPAPQHCLSELFEICGDVSGVTRDLSC
jgi:hypothetical protein